MVPYSADVTNVLWYNKQILSRRRRQPPTTWADLLAACDTLERRGHHPDRVGQQGPLGGGQLARPPGLARRRRGVLRADARRDRQVHDPGVGDRRSATSRSSRDHKCVNDSANAIDDNAGAQLFFQGKAAMHADRVVARVAGRIDEAPDLDFDYVNLPAMPRRQGQPGQRDRRRDRLRRQRQERQDRSEAAEFMALLNSDANVQELIEAEVTPLDEVRVGGRGDRLPQRAAQRSCSTRRRRSCCRPTPATTSKMADALYTGHRGRARRPADARGRARRRSIASSAADASRVGLADRPPPLRGRRPDHCLRA